MSLIEKVAKAIGDYVMGEQSINLGMAATAAISAMPSIKWQKIETLPEEYRDGDKVFLAWNRSYNRVDSCIWLGAPIYILKHYSHWAEINAPEEE